MNIEIIAEISRDGVGIAEISYRTGFHVEIRVCREYQDERIRIPLTHSDNKELEGTWEHALDRYFNEGRFDSKDAVCHGEMRRVGSAKDHRALFRQALRALMKDLTPQGYEVKIHYP
jgi:hypothetical protein